MNLELDSEVEQACFQVALSAIENASDEVLKYWPSPSNRKFDRSLELNIQDKEIGTGNYATIADKESERIILEAIRANEFTRNHGILAEESDEVLSNSDWQWVIDPIDGTPPFKNGLPDFGISIGILKNGVPTIGMIAMPALRQIIVAKHRKGWERLSYRGNQRSWSTKVAPPISALDKSLIGYDLGYTERGRQLMGVVAKIADRIGYPVSYGSSSTANFRLALGHLGGYFCTSPTKYDIGAASVIIPEIGGVVTDMDGNPIDWNKKSVSYLAGRTPELHQALLDAIQS